MTSSGRGRRGRLRALLMVLIVALPLGVYLWGRNSSAFAVERIELSGARRVSAARAAKTLRAEFLGDNLFGVRAEQVAAALKPFPYFAHVEIDRDFPNTLRVRIVEYRPAAVLFSRGRWYVVSREGRVLLRLPGVVARPSAADEAAAQASVAVGQGAGDGVASGATATTAAPASDTTAAATGASGTTPAETTSASPAASTAADSTGAAASAAAANDAAALAASLSSSALGAPAHVPSLFAGDLTAEILAAATPPRQANRLPVLVTKKKVKVGGTVADRSVHDALAVLVALPPGIRRQVLYVKVAPAGIDVVLRNGATYAFGDGHDLVNKALALRAVLAVYLRHHVRATWIDISVPNRPLGTPVIVNRTARVQSARPTPLATAKATPKATPRATPTTQKTGPSPTASSSPATGKTASASPRPTTAAASP